MIRKETMNNNSFEKPKNTIRNKYISRLLLAFFLFNIFTINTAFAEENPSSYATVSYGALTHNIDNDNRSAIIAQNKTMLITDQLTTKATGKSREQIISEQQTQNLSGNLSQTRSLSLSISSDYFYEFSIYNATTVLHSDDDQDGFYQTLSVIFDADINGNNNIGNVYAKLYLSQNGSPWSHYYTTDSFTIYNDSEQDTYEVITTFRDSYPPGYYDVLIDLYQVGYSGIVATYSADNSSALFALPLESSNNDDVYVEGVYVYHGGSFSLGLLIILLTTLIFRLKKRTVIQ
jgi:hypothetical protein